MKENIYIAGPECFYQNGNKMLLAMRREAEARGYDVSLPNDDKLIFSDTDLRHNADEIFNNCAKAMNLSTAIICDLEFYRGPEADGGSVFELGMAYARNIRRYAYTRDKREMKWKYNGYTMRNGLPYDRKGRILPYYNLPFSPNVTASTKIVQGSFYDCLNIMELDLEEERKQAACNKPEEVEEEIIQSSNTKTKTVYIAGPERYEENAKDIYKNYRLLFNEYDIKIVTPFDGMENIPSNITDAYTRAYLTLKLNESHVKSADIIIANLNDFHGWEPDEDTSFECGMAYQLGKKMYGYVDSTIRMRDRVPNLGENNQYRDICGCNVENFDYPLNLMFSSSMKIFEGKLENILPAVLQDNGMNITMSL